MDGHSFFVLANQCWCSSVISFATTVLLLNINDLISTTSKFIHSFADDSTLHADFQLPKPSSNLELDGDGRMTGANKESQIAYPGIMNGLRFMKQGIVHSRECNLNWPECFYFPFELENIFLSPICTFSISLN